MAQGIRSRRQLLGALLLATGAGIAGACTGQKDTPQATEPPPHVDVGNLTAGRVVAAVLQQCHATLRGMDRVAVTLTLPDDSQLQCLTALPARVRVQLPDGSVQLHEHGGRAVAIEGSKAIDLDVDASRRLRAVATLLDAAALGPLYRATACERTGPRTFRLQQPGGDPVEMVLAADSLLVEQLTIGGNPVTVHEHLRTSTTWIIRTAEIEPLGCCKIRFEATDFAWDESLFAIPGATPAAPPPAPRTTGAIVTRNAEARPTTPTIVQDPARRWLLVDDPGSWERRAEVASNLTAALAATGHRLQGFIAFLHDGGRSRMAVGFRAGADSSELVIPPGSELRELPSTRLLVVFPPQGSFEERWARGAEQLEAVLRERGLSATGPVTAQPYLHLQEGLPEAAKLAACVVRVAMPVQ